MSEVLFSALLFSSMFVRRVLSRWPGNAGVQTAAPDWKDRLPWVELGHRQSHTDHVHVHMTAGGITKGIIRAAACQRKVPLLLIFTHQITIACMLQLFCLFSGRERKAFSLFTNVWFPGSKQFPPLAAGCLEPAARQPNSASAHGKLKVNSRASHQLSLCAVLKGAVIRTSYHFNVSCSYIYMRVCLM